MARILSDSQEVVISISDGARVIAGVDLPNSPLIVDTILYAKRLSDSYLFNHAMRSWLFAESIGRAKGLHYDREVVAVGTILHDIGLTAGISGDNRFEVNGANAARSFIAGRGLDDRRAQLIWDLVALNSTPSLALHKEPEVAVGTMGIALDFGGFFLDTLKSEEVAEIVAAFPRAMMKERFKNACCRVVVEQPATSYDNFLSDFGARFVPNYKKASTVDMLMNAPFDE